MPEDHVIKIKRDEVKAKITSFEWIDDEEEDPDLPDFVVEESDIDEFSEVLAVCVLDTLSPEYFQINDEGTKFEFPVNLGLSPILEERFSNKWNLESRLSVFNSLRDKLRARFNDPVWYSRLDKSIENAMPSEHRRKKMAPASVEIFDDVFSMDSEDVGTVSVEIPIHFTAN